MSTDEGKRLIESLEKRGKSSILVSWETNADGQISKGDRVRVQASDSLDNEATAKKLMAVAVQLNQYLGLLPSDFLDRYSETTD